MTDDLQKPMRLQDVAARIGVAAITLRRWLLAGKVPEVSRDRNGWRFFTQKDIKKIRKFAGMKRRPRK